MRVVFEFMTGEKVRDEVTGIEGVITAATIWINGCKRYGIERILDGKVKDDWFDEGRLKRVPADPVAVEDKGPGGPQRDPVQRIGG